MTNILTKLQTAFPELQFAAEAPLAPYTSVKIGGPAEVLTAIETTATLAALVKFCRDENIPVTILGWGANTLIADRGLRGLVIRNLTRELAIDRTPINLPDAVLAQSTTITSPRHHSTSPDQDFASLDYQEPAGTPRIVVTVASGWSLPSLINTLLSAGITGLQWYARIPATIGGAIVNNIHGGTHFLSEVIESVRVLTPTGHIETLSAAACEFDYDFSRFHYSNEIILDVRLRLWQGDVAQAQATLAQWATRKRLQPQRSLGCVFQNLTPDEQQRLHLPSPSIGYIIDQVLGMKGERIGGAVISPHHAAFIENTGGATAQDYLELTRAIFTAAKTRLGIALKPEIFFLGFEAAQLRPMLASDVREDNSR